MDYISEVMEHGITIPMSDALQSSKRIVWADVARGIAIIAVVLDHAMYIFPLGSVFVLRRHLYFSVTWFMVLSGFMCARYLSGLGNSIGAKGVIQFWRKRIPIFGGYIYSSIFSYVLLVPNPNLHELVTSILYFRVLPPHYFLFALFQMWVIAPVVWWAIAGKNIAVWILTLALTVGIGYVVVLRSLPWAWTSANIFLGGPYLPMFFFGMLLFRIKAKTWRFVRVCFIIIFAVSEYVYISFPVFSIDFVPTIRVFLWAILSLFLVEITVSLTKKLLSPLWQVFGFIGRHSLTIFFYHYVILLIGVRLQFVRTIWHFYLWTGVALVPPVLVDVVLTMLHTAKTKKFEQ